MRRGFTYFGMKAHFGVNCRTKLIHAAVVTPANVSHGITQSAAWPRDPRLG
jgi:hypothetical protein